VNKPGVYPIKGKTSLVQAIAMAGDLNTNSDSSILILRQNDGKRMAGRFDLSAIQKGSADDPTLQAGDQIVAGSSAIKKGFNAILKALPLVGTFALL
jgi:polysaccharide export outer membrane protein